MRLISPRFCPLVVPLLVPDPSKIVLSVAFDKGYNTQRLRRIPSRPFSFGLDVAKRALVQQQGDGGMQKRAPRDSAVSLMVVSGNDLHHFAGTAGTPGTSLIKRLNMGSGLLSLARSQGGPSVHHTSELKQADGQFPADDQPSRPAGRRQVLRQTPSVALARGCSLPPLRGVADHEAGT